MLLRRDKVRLEGNRENIALELQLRLEYKIETEIFCTSIILVISLAAHREPFQIIQVIIIHEAALVFYGLRPKRNSVSSSHRWPSLVRPPALSRIILCSVCILHAIRRGSLKSSLSRPLAIYAHDYYIDKSASRLYFKDVHNDERTYPNFAAEVK